jgi:hypothetical protein
VNTVAFDVFVDWYLQGSADLYSPESECHCCIGFRQNVVSNPVHILNNPDHTWRCLITLCFVARKGMRVCTCRFHSSKDTLEYIHAPTNPTGSITFEGDNDLAQVVVVPRTVRSFQAKTFSNSYQLNRAMGTYSGIDTIDLTNQLDYGEQERSHLSFVRDMIAMNQRSDYRSFISKLPEKDRQITRKHAKALLKESDELCNGQEVSFTQYKVGATYVPLEDAFDLQIHMKKEGSRSILHVNKESGNMQSTNFLPKWPSRIIRVLPAGCEYGSRFRGCPGFQKKKHIVWFVLYIAHFMPELWRSMDSTVKRSTDWEG